MTSNRLVDGIVIAMRSSWQLFEREHPDRELLRTSVVDVLMPALRRGESEMAIEQAIARIATAAHVQIPYGSSGPLAVQIMRLFKSEARQW
jgi:hypothetical protein